MPNNPFVKPAPADKRIMPPRTALVPGGGVPAGEALNNWLPEELIDGSICFVLSEGSLFIFDKFSNAAPTASIIATCRGTGVPGRWLEYSVAAASKDFLAISYANPNAGGAQGISATPTVPATWTAFDSGLGSVVLNDSGGDLNFVLPHAIQAVRAMTVKLDWFMSYFIATGGPYYEVGVLKNGGTPVPGSVTRTYYPGGATGNQNANIGATTIVTLAQNDVFILAVQILGSATDAVFVMDFGTLVVTEL